MVTECQSICLLDFLFPLATRTWLVYPTPNEAVGEVVVLVKHVSLLNEEVRGEGNRRGTWSSLLPTGAIGEKIFPLECHQAMGVIGIVWEVPSC